MVAKTKPDEKKPDEKPKPLFPALASGVDENGMRWEDVDIFGTTYRVRRITVDESDEAYDASQNADGTFNARLNQRMELCAAIVSPSTDVSDIGSWDTLKLRALIFVFDRINNLPAADSEGNA